jgi:hypothetical protein
VLTGDGYYEEYTQLITPGKVLMIDEGCNWIGRDLQIIFRKGCTPLPATNTMCPGLCRAPAGYQVAVSGANLEPCPANHYNDGSAQGS